MHLFSSIEFGIHAQALLLFCLSTLIAVILYPLNIHASSLPASPYTIVLGVAQDAGYPHAGCVKPCCEAVWTDPSRQLFAASIAIVDPVTNDRWIIDATPDFKWQLNLLNRLSPVSSLGKITGIFLTHAHIGHYAGLMHLGREVMGSSGIPVYVMPRMKEFLDGNGPWNQLLSLKNIEIRPLFHQAAVRLNERIVITPFLVPHRDEYSETVGFHIEGPSRSVLFIPDINKWEKWETRVEDKIKMCDVAYLDGTFFGNGEIVKRDMSEIPHPFIEESLGRFQALSAKEKSKIRFIHLNHTNPALIPDSDARKKVLNSGFFLAGQSERTDL